MGYDNVFVKDPNADLDYNFDWTEWLQAGEVISVSTMTVTSGLGVDSSSHTSTSATAWLIGGTAGKSYKLVNEITTNQGRTDQRTMIIRVQDR